MTQKQTNAPTIKQLAVNALYDLFFLIDGVERKATTKLTAIKTRPGQPPMLVFEWTNSNKLPSMACMTWEAFEAQNGTRVELGDGEVLERKDFVK